MAVYTEVGFDEAARLMRNLGLGELTQLQGIQGGIENTNYFASTDNKVSAEGAESPGGHRDWVLTLFERLPAAELPYYLQLMQHLAEHGIPVPAPQAGPDGHLVHQVAGRPAAVVTRLPGSHRPHPLQQHAAQVGSMLARMHKAAASFALQQPHPRGLAWWQQTAPQVLPHLGPDQAALLQSELDFQQALADSALGLSLPQGPIHADLFRDNVMFCEGQDEGGGDKLSGFFDFYFAGTDWLLFDLAVCLNDWCCDDQTAQLDATRAKAFVSAYHKQRPLTGAECRALPAMMRAAALRFWISRLWDWHLPRNASLLQAKDPGQFERVLRARVEQPWHPLLEH